MNPDNEDALSIHIRAGADGLRASMDLPAAVPAPQGSLDQEPDEDEQPPPRLWEQPDDVRVKTLELLLRTNEVFREQVARGLAKIGDVSAYAVCREVGQSYIDTDDEGIVDGFRQLLDALVTRLCELGVRGEVVREYLQHRAHQGTVLGVLRRTLYGVLIADPSSTTP